jgi:hypothetical protein
MGNGEWGMGNGEWGMGNGEWGMGNGDTNNQLLLTSITITPSGSIESTTNYTQTMATTTTLTTLLNHLFKPLSTLLTTYTTTCLVPPTGLGRSAPPPPSEFTVGHYHFEFIDLVSPLHHITCFFHVLKSSKDPRIWVFAGIITLLFMSLITTLVHWAWRTFVRVVKVVGAVAVLAVAGWVLVEIGVLDVLVQVLDWIFLEKDGV